MVAAFTMMEGKGVMAVQLCQDHAARLHMETFLRTPGISEEEEEGAFLAPFLIPFKVVPVVTRAPKASFQPRCIVMMVPLRLYRIRLELVGQANEGISWSLG